MTAKITIVQDTREKAGKGWEFRASANCEKMIKKKLDVGDYSLLGLEHLICIERKTLGDLYGTLGRPDNYKRFLKEWERAKNHPVKYLVIEASLPEVDSGYGYSQVPPSNIHAKLISLQIKHGVHVIFAGRKDSARGYVRRLLLKLAEYHKKGVING